MSIVYKPYSGRSSTTRIDENIEKFQEGRWRTSEEVEEFVEAIWSSVR